jgi:hypothetical protein
MVRFFVMSTYSDLNPRFNGNVIYLRLIILSVVGDILIYNEMLFDRFC